jgi:hypothetical protein
MLDVRCARRRTGAASSKNAKHKTYPRARLVNQTPKRLGLPKDRAARCAAGRAATPPRRRDRKPPEPSCLAAVCGSASWWSWSWRPGPGQAGRISGPVAGGAQNRRWRCVPGVASCCRAAVVVVGSVTATGAGPAAEAEVHARPGQHTRPGRGSRQLRAVRPLQVVVEPEARRSVVFALALEGALSDGSQCRRFCRARADARTRPAAGARRPACLRSPRSTRAHNGRI